MVEINSGTCTGCGACVKDCALGYMALREEKAHCNELCFLCGHCVAVCPTGAVSIPEYDMPDVEANDKDHFGIDPGVLLHSIKFRRSIRQYANRLIEREKLEYLVQAGRYTATGSNQQGCLFVMVQKQLPELKDMIWDGVSAMKKPSEMLPERLFAPLQSFVSLRADGTDFLFRDAPAVIYIAAESAVDAGLAAQNMELAAISQGLGVLYNGFLKTATNMNPAVREWLDIADKPVQVCMLAGYPRVTYCRTAPRRAANVHWR